MAGEVVWVDVDRCTGCGACVDVCATASIALVDGKARVDENTCTGCRACVGACPEDAIQPVVQGELVAARETPRPTTYQPLPLTRSAAGAIAVAGIGFLAKAVGALGRAVSRWLASLSTPASARGQMPTRSSRITPVRQAGGRAGQSRRMRHRHRGR